MKKILPALVAGFGAGVFSIIPITKALACCFIVPLAAIAAIYLQVRVNGEIPPIAISKGIVLGLLTGIFAAFFGTLFDVIITMITKTNDLVEGLPQMQQAFQDLPVSDELKQQAIDMIGAMADEISEKGFSLLYTFSIGFNNFLFDAIFGFIGGLIGIQIINKRMK
ncbi:MAG: hypothetical protein K9J12_00315 [Melioribacteraceae bacterium]|nr:hypothetical protein [Melioribacteraceae bacterium]MCF8264344.1 hypothetical protein [Melioribacteraceae bacterium]MCF8431580.1 hypothetical protein [Melioribacteraceae bacterium]